MKQARLTQLLRSYRRPSLPHSFLQIVISFGGLLSLCVAIYLLRDQIWPLLLLIPLAAFFVVRVFIIQHDCGHHAFFRVSLLNHILGLFCSLFTFTPYWAWRRQHAGHHRVWNNLDRRQSGLDIYSGCLTVGEYRSLSRARRGLFRIAHHPLIANIILPPLVFLVLYRLPFDTPRQWRRERFSVYATNAGIAILFGILTLALGWKAVALVYGPVICLAAVIGVWLFSVQHRFPGVQWYRNNEWSHEKAALAGSSYLRLPVILNWLTGNIGYHHIHHLSPSIPNYRLRPCHKALEGSGSAPSGITFWSLMRRQGLVLWDEDSSQIISAKQADLQASSTVIPA